MNFLQGKQNIALVKEGESHVQTSRCDGLPCSLFFLLSALLCYKVDIMQTYPELGVVGEKRLKATYP